MNKETKIKERLEKHYSTAMLKYGKEAVLGVFLYGSQNYNTDIEGSDVDTKCILIPNIRTLACYPYEVKHLDVDGEVCECMSIQHMVANWKKQNINFVEIMFTPYCKINPIYESLWYDFVGSKLRDRVARYDVKKAILSMANQALHTYFQDPSDFKKQMNTTRLQASLLRITDSSRPYWECIHFEDEVANELREIRAIGAEAADMQDRIDNLNYYIARAAQYTADPEEQEATNSALDDLIVAFIRTRLNYEVFNI